MQTELIEVDYDQDLYEEMKLEDKDLYVAYKIIYEGDDIPEDELENYVTGIWVQYTTK